LFRRQWNWPFDNLPELEIDGIRPAKADHILRVASRHRDLRVARHHVVFFADGSVGSEAGVDRRVEVARDAHGVGVEAHDVESGNGDPVGGRPAARLIPLQAAVVGAHGEAAGTLEQVEFLLGGIGLFARGHARPERVERCEVGVGGRFVAHEIKIGKDAFFGLPQVTRHGGRPRVGAAIPVESVLRFAQ